MSMGIDMLIKEAVQQSGLPEDKISEVTSMMVKYLNTGAKYGKSVEGFFKWYTNDMRRKVL